MRQTVTLEVGMPYDLFTLLGVPRAQAGRTVTEFVALGLYQENKISDGKAAELLGMTRWEFIGLLARKGIPYWLSGISQGARLGLPNPSHVWGQDDAALQDTGIWQSPWSGTLQSPREPPYFNYSEEELEEEWETVNAWKREQTVASSS